MSSWANFRRAAYTAALGPLFQPPSRFDSDTTSINGTVLGDDVRLPKPILLAIFILILGISASADDDALVNRANTILQRARELSQSSDNTSKGAYKESGTFTLYRVVAGTANGTIHKYFADSKNWIEEIRVGTYQKIVAQKGDDKYDHDNSDFTPLMIQRALTPDLEIGEHQKLKKITEVKIGETEADCVYLDPRDRTFYSASHTLCFDSSKGTLLQDEQPDKTVTWSDYQDVAGWLLPAHIEISQHGSKTLDAVLSYQSDPALTPAGIKIPVGIKPHASCSKVDPPKVLTRGNPVFPPGQRNSNATVVLQVILGTDGRVHETQVAQTAGKAFDDEAEKAARDYRFRPAMCNGTPMQVTIEIEMKFELH